MPVTSGGASRLTSPSSDEVSGATTPTTPVGSGIVKLKYGAATGFDEPRTWAILSAQPAYQTQRSIARSTTARAAAGRRPLGRGDLAGELLAAALHQLRDAVQDLAAVHGGLGGPARGTPRARPGPRRAGPCARPGRRWRAACRRPRRRRTSDPIRSAGTRRRCTACRSCGPRPGRGRGGRGRVLGARRRPRGSCRCGRAWRPCERASPSAVLEPDVGEQAVQAALAPEARLLVATERRRSGRTG